ncbi:sodium/bile acid cotransporter-like [Solea senegalensis]|uniref:Sodium/bile acid cotransporter-like n=1 Tax=Solea senegalensis TaxID=28829 RepID=A0AAV6RXG3_SOLSE|nr:sodium/bile acid cotransporter-like [Solea senegalensis]
MSCSSSRSRAKQVSRRQQSCFSMNDSAALISDLHLWLNQRFQFNATAANATFAMRPLADKTISVIVIVILFIAMVAVGCIMDVTKIKSFLVKPKGVAVAVLCQFGVMPLTAFCLAKAFQLRDSLAVVVLICGCCPGGALSNVLTLAAGGDINLSLVMTSASTVLSLGFMPLLLFIYCQAFPSLQGAVPYGRIALNLIMILVPCSIGIFINRCRPQYSRTIKRVGYSTMALSLVVVGAIVVYQLGAYALILLFPPLVASAALLPVIGFVLGYVLTSCCSLTHAERRTVALETGCQQCQLAMTIMKTAFPPAMIGPLFLFPMLVWFFQLTGGCVMIMAFRCHQMFTRKRKGKNKI